MRKTVQKLSFLVISLISISLSAQVSIGSSNVPEVFSVLQLDETTNPRGLRLPQISVFTTINSNVAVGANRAAGLTIYGVDSNRLNYWDGTKWRETGENLVIPGSGLMKKEYHIGLGAPLTKNTTVSLLSNNLNFNTNLSTFSLNKYLSVTKGRVSIDAKNIQLGSNEELTVSGYVSENSNTIAMNGDFAVKSGSTKFLSDDSGLDLNNNLRLEDSTRPTSQAAVDETNMKKKYYAFSNDNKGDVFWSKLSPQITIEKGTFLTGNISFVGNPARPATNSLTLSTGKWLVYARYPFLCSISGTQWMYIWSTIQDSAGVIRAGVGTSVDTNGYSMPEVMGLVEVKGTSDTFTLYVSTSNNNYAANWLSNNLINIFGKPEFFAILLDKPINR